MTWRLARYIDLDTAYAVPTDGGLGSAGWFRQAAHDLEVIWAATGIGGGVNNNRGAIEFLPTWSDCTKFNAGYHYGAYIQVGAICYMWAGIWVSAIGSTGVGVALPIAPADTLLPMAAGHFGMQATNNTDYTSGSCLIEGSTLKLYDAQVAGPLVQGSYPVTTYELSVFAAYRCVPATAEGRLNAYDRLLSEQYPTYTT